MSKRRRIGQSTDTIIYKGTGERLVEDISAVTGAGSGDLGTLCTYNGLNPWAKYKPFRNEAKHFNSAAAKNQAALDAGYGFKSSLNNFNFSGTQASPDWQVGVQLPRGIASNEPYRAFDFIDEADNSTDGYDHLVGPPIEFDFPYDSNAGEYVINQEGSQIVVKFDRNVSGWYSDTGIPISSILNTAGSNNWGDYHLAVRFILNNAFTNTIVTEYTCSQFDTSLYPTIMFKGTGTGLGLEIPMFADSGSQNLAYDGDIINTTICLIPGSTAESMKTTLGATGYPYVIPEEYNQYSLGSLNLRNNMDTKNLIFYEANSISGSKAYLAATISQVTTAQGDLKTYKIDNVSVVYTTRGPRWNALQAAKCKIYLQVRGASWYLSSDQAGQTDVEPDNSTPYWSENVLILNSDSQNSIYTEAAMNSSDTIPHTAAALVTNSSGGNFHQIKRPYIHFIGGGSGSSATLTFSGYLFSGRDVVDPPVARRIDFDSNPSTDTKTVSLT